MKSISAVTSILTLLAIFSTSAQAAYQYTYTGQPFQYVENDLPSGPALDITTDDFMKIVITSDNLLTEWNDYPLADASYVFTVGGFSNQAQENYFDRYTQIISELRIRNLDENGLPDSWLLQIGRTEFLNGNTDYINGFGYYSDTEFNQFGVSTRTPTEYRHLFAVGAAGTWQMKEIISPVPENPQSAMFLLGLGCIAFVNRRKFL